MTNSDVCDPAARPTRYRHIEVAGTAREMGQQLGEAVGEEIRGFVEAAMRLVHKTTRVTRQHALRVARQSAEYARCYAPHMMDELAGVAESSRVPLDELMLLQVRNQLRGTDDHACTSFSVVSETPQAASGKHLVGQNWDNDPQLDDFTIVLTRRPVDCPSLINVTQAGLIAYIGMNDAGLGVCLNSLPSPGREVGVPHYFTVRAIYESRGLDEAVAHVRRADRAIGANLMLATPESPANLEVTIDDVHVLCDERQLAHTNHCLHSDLRNYNEQFPELIQSHARFARINELLCEPGRGMPMLQRALRDHDGYPRSICRHVNEDPQYGFWATVFSVILDTQDRCMYVARGNPCQQPFEAYRF